MRPLSFDLYDIVSASDRGGPDASLLEMALATGANYGNVRATLSRMVRRGTIRRIYQGVYRLPVPRRA
jgi:DNA-binding transcriptional regulator PaaX